MYAYVKHYTGRSQTGTEEKIRTEEKTAQKGKNLNRREKNCFVL